ncbi:TPA: hypothetical protein QC445_005022 [Bacillus cereus]|uniref:ABC-three component system middle component 1 n=1 Tax=Bacillus wiedmannii TaxID=1890302 RepID=UPI0028833FC2|nr:ABC-three component system middle component 1 [Bacillus wiedmannii]WMS85103.1 hypothetical protein RE438_28050 [Bacillus wiedmannii]HDR8488137.1 hypothetical protein [Bacillus cereus]
MRLLLEQIFKESNFEIIKNIELINPKETFIAIDKTENRKNYYLVIFLKDSISREIIDREFVYFLPYIKKQPFYTSDMDKNFSLLVCLNVENEELNEELQKEIFEIEEDPYDFKKYVLVYTSNEIKHLKEELNSAKHKFPIVFNGVSPIINQILMDTNRFSTFKNKEGDHAYNLITNIFIKLPIFKIDSGDEKEMLNLRNIIKKEFGDNQEDSSIDYEYYIDSGNLLIEKKDDESLDEIKNQILNSVYSKGGIEVE